MEATDLIKSLSLTSDISSENYKVLTQYKEQEPEMFLKDNIEGYEMCQPKLVKPICVESVNFLAISENNPRLLTSPDGKSVIMPDYVVKAHGEDIIYLYKFY